MTITKKENGKSFTLSVEGRLDTLTSPELEKEINELSASAEALVVDFAKLEYISSAGLRVLLSAHKLFAKKSGMTITNVSETVLDIFEVTGFKDILTIK